MDLWQLNIFCKVVEKRSFSKAGQAVHLSQPTVSSHIKDLEAHFRCQLIDRLSTAAVPTPAGELLYGYAKRMLSLKTEMASALSEFLGTITGHLTIGGSTIPGNYILPGLMGKFSAHYPDVRMSLVVEDTAAIVGHVVRGDIEVGLVGGKTDDAGIAQDVFIEDDMALVVPAGHPLAARSAVTLAELHNAPFIIRESGSGTRQSFEECLRAAGHAVDRLAVVAEMGSTEAVIQAIRGGLGVSILSRLAVSDACGGGQLKALSIRGVDLKRHFYLTRHRHRTLSPTSRAFVDFLTAIPPDQRSPQSR
ncbi:MAG: selenium metabolism-associated LysR family transcriptional regulator [Pseudomonadota bacterium]